MRRVPSNVMFMSIFVLLSVGCRTLDPQAAQVVSSVEEDDGMRTLFRCTPEVEDAVVENNLKIVAFAEDEAVPPQNVFISIGDGVRVRSVCGERRDLGLKSVFACWYSGGGLTIYWPGSTPDSEDVVQLDRNRMFGAIDNAMNRLKCTRKASLDILSVDEKL